MGRKQYRIDLQNTTFNPPSRISEINATDDGEITFAYSYEQNGAQRLVTLGLLSLNTDGYPFENDYMLFTKDDVDASMSMAFQDIAAVASRKTLVTALTEISDCLYQIVTGCNKGSSDTRGVRKPTYKQGEKAELDEKSDEEWYNGFEDDDNNDEAFRLVPPQSLGTTRLVATKTSASQIPDEQRQAITADLVSAHAAGFKVGVLGNLTTVGIVCVSIKISKLGISHEAMKAWNVQGQQYFMVLIRFLQGYKDLDHFIQASPESNHPVEIKVVLCTKYKPSEHSAFDAFVELGQNDNTASHQPNKKNGTEIQQLFIGRPLNEPFKNKFASILKFRKQFGLDWSAAERMVHDQQGTHVREDDLQKYRCMREEIGAPLSNVLRADSLVAVQNEDCAQSLPLLTMQFALRHFVRCTEFCLVCHCSTDTKFEALKPYVCSSPLCLYQYMSLGFGPNVELEILSQPYVVDLLVSFCYARARSGKLEDFPDGMNLKVPILPYYTHRASMHTGLPTPRTTTTLETSKALRTSYNAHRREAIFAVGDTLSADLIRCGDWVIVAHGDNASYTCHRVDSVLCRKIKLGPPLYIGSSCGTSQTQSLLDISVQSDVFLFSYHFDELDQLQKQAAILALLDTLPPVKQMVRFLKTRGENRDPTLRLWQDHVIGSALNVLRWIIASNRSCIMQVDNVVDPDHLDGSEPFEDRVSDVQKYMQFRFVQGAPDKEQRFLECVQQHSISKEYPTLFAWHGSALHNWHSIIREGLHFKDTINGRAFGHGVYMSQQAATSAGYSQGSCDHQSMQWPHSELKISSAMSLNEIVNNPPLFVHSQTHYVVDKVDWIQTRYLMVGTTAPHTKDRGCMAVVKQDPTRPLYGFSRVKVEIPLTAISKSRRPPNSSPTYCDNGEYRFIGGNNFDQTPVSSEDAISVATMEEDREWLKGCLEDDQYGAGLRELDSSVEVEDSDDFYGRTPSRKRPKLQSSSIIVIAGCLVDTESTNWVPGTLDMTNITVLPAPDDARLPATKTLMRAFKSVCSTQMTTAAHELGWYVDPESTDNMYQWIFELHSFEKSLPLAADMEAAGEQSIVIEMRFTNEFPISPPFVRVLQPRFLPFNQGGGGHVTEGGAICMELLTTNGWLPANSIESTLLQIRLAISEKEHPARLLRRAGKGFYGVTEAIEAYERACRAHGWKVPEAFATFRSRS